MLSRGDNLGVGGEQDVEAKALRSVRWYARRWREKLSQTWLQSCRKMPSPAASCWASDPQRWIDIKRNQCLDGPCAQKTVGFLARVADRLYPAPSDTKTQRKKQDTIAPPCLRFLGAWKGMHAHRLHPCVKK